MLNTGHGCNNYLLRNPFTDSTRDAAHQDGVELILSFYLLLRSPRACR